MLSLKEQALLSLAKEKTTFGELIAFCESKQEINDLCYYSKRFWFEILPLVGLGVEALCFEPLKEKYWRNFIQGLVEGISYQKYFELDDYHENLQENPNLDLILYSLPQAELNLPDFDKTHFCRIPSIKFPSGTEGWIVEFSFDQELSDIKNVFVLAGRENDRNRLLDIMSLLYVNKLRRSVAKLEPYKIVNELPGNLGFVKIENNLWKLDEANGVNIFDFAFNTYPSQDLIRSLLDSNLGEMNGPNWLNANLTMFSRNPYLRNPEDVYDQYAETSFNLYKCKIY